MDNLISKKELLGKYGISYGALYRWKRMGLIPEEWFVKKSAVTGQETFFERELICRRIEMILGLKDSLSLEEIAKQLEDEESAKGERVLKVSWQGTVANIPLENITSLCIVDSQGKEISEDTAKLRALIKELTENNRKERE
jgi:DNA-binding transcriptional MerR regulator